jgi:transcriptional regulator
MDSSRDGIPPGTLEMLILTTLARHKEMHGFEIASSIQAVSEDVLQVEEGSLYPALQRMLIKGWLIGEWGRTDENRRARYYRLTLEGRRQLAEEIEGYRRVSAAIARILQFA